MLRKLRECVVPVDRRWRDNDLEQGCKRAGSCFDSFIDECLPTVRQEHFVAGLEVAGGVFDGAEVVAGVVVKTIARHSAPEPAS